MWLRMLLLMRLSTHTRNAIKEQTEQRSVYLLNAHTFCTIFLPNWMQYIVFIDSFNLLIFLCNRKNPVKWSACLVSQKIVIECGIVFLEIHLFLENHSEFNEICHKILMVASNGSVQKNWTLTEENLDIPVF